MARLIIDIDSAGAIKSINRLETEVSSFAKNAERQMKQVNSSVSLLKTGAMGLGAIFAGSIAIDYIKQVGQIADIYTNINSKLGLVTQSQEEFNTVYESLYNMGLKTGTTLETNAQAFSKLAFAMQETPRSDITGYLDTVNKSLAVSGAETQEASAFMLQFAQAMGSGVVAGDELRTMIEANSYLMSKVAKQLGTNTKGLKTMGAEGTLTAKVFGEALAKVSKDVDSDFSQMNLTIDRAINQLNEVFRRIIGDSNEASGASNKVAESISNLATVIDENREGITSLFTGVIDSAGDVVESVAKITPEIKKILDSVNSTAGLSGMDLGIMGYLLFKGKGGYAVLYGMVVTLNEQLAHYNLNIGNLKTSYDNSRNSIQNLIDVATGKRDWNTGELKESVDEANESVKDLFNSVDDDWEPLELEVKTEQAKEDIEALFGMAEKEYEKYSKSVQKMNKEIHDEIKSINETIADINREGMKPDEAFDDVLKQIDSYKQKAAEAAKSGKWEKQKEILKEIASLYKSLPTEVKGEKATEKEIKGAKKVLDYWTNIYNQQRSWAGRNTYAQKVEEATKKLKELQDSEKNGGKELISAEEIRRTKVEGLKEVKDALLKIERETLDVLGEQATVTEGVKNELINKQNLEEGKEAITQVQTEVENLKDKTTETGEAFIQVGETWTNVCGGMEEDVVMVENAIEDLMNMLDEAKSKSSSISKEINSSIDGKRALGGPVQAGKTYLVGEKGKELFTPNQSGYITPNNKLENSFNNENLGTVNIDLGKGQTVTLQGNYEQINKLNKYAKDRQRFSS